MMTLACRGRVTALWRRGVWRARSVRPHTGLHKMRNLLTLCCLLHAASASVVVRRVPCAARMSECARGDAKLFRVYLRNDDYHMREYVVRVLMMVCEVSSSEATSIIMEANKDRWKNRALCGTWEEQLALHVHAGLQKAGLTALLKPDECGVDEEHSDQDEPIMETYLDGTPIESDEDLPRYYQ